MVRALQFAGFLVFDEGVGAPRAWCERRMLRREGEVLRLGTAIGRLSLAWNEDVGIPNGIAEGAADVSAGLCMKHLSPIKRDWVSLAPG